MSSNLLGYRKILESKLIKTIHRITFKTGYKKESLARMLNQVPDGAVITEIVETDGGIAHIEFCEEKLDEEGMNQCKTWQIHY